MYKKFIRNLENFKKLQEGFKEVDKKRKGKGEVKDAGRNNSRS